MARLSKRSLLNRVEEAIRLSGWSILYLSEDAHPARYRIYRGAQNFDVKVYIWNITHGGATRSADEYRIQVTGVSKFDLEPGAQNLLLGYWDEVATFTGWDIRQHLGQLGSSPSMQVSVQALRQSLLTGFAPYANRNGETAVAFRPDFMGTYIQYLEPIHDSGQVPKEASILAQLSEDAEAVEDEEIEGDVAPPRAFAVIATKRALRALDFGRRVLAAYGHQCAMCGVQLRLVDAAHILPASDPNSTDQTQNGVALCPLHHRAYDRALVTFDANLEVYQNTAAIRSLEAEDRSGGLPEFRKALRRILIAPADRRDRPSERFVAEANRLRGWNL
jgi:putative restriction endonuclease